METPLIRYNLKDRGRQHTGQARNFNIRALCDSINSDACQETVATRSMTGFYGHFPRIRFGMNPAEGGLDGGKYVPVDPAFITTHLKADYDGNVEHRCEFLDTAAGRIAAKLFDSKVGGFSSAIDQSKPEFYGFDYVLAPNFIGNSHRGVVLDDAYSGKVSMTYDDVYEAEQDENAHSMILLLDNASKEREQFNMVIEHLRQENDELIDLMAKHGLSRGTSLDSAFKATLVMSKDTVGRFEREAAQFRNAELLRFNEPESGEHKKSQAETRLLARYGL